MSLYPSQLTNNHTSVKTHFSQAPVDLISGDGIGRLAGHSYRVNPNAPVTDVVERFKLHPELPGVLIVEKGNLLGALSAKRCNEELSQPYGNDLFLKRPILHMYQKLGLVPLVLPHTTSIERAVQIALSRTLRERYDPVIVSFDLEHLQLVDMHVLLLAQSHLLDSARQTAQQANKLKSEFLAHMSHELRTPLNAILNFSAFVAAGLYGEVNLEQVEALQRVDESANHLLSLINDVLGISKIEAGMMNLFVEDVDVNQAAQVVASIAKGLLKQKPIELRLEIEPDLPVIRGDKRRVRQIFLNLVSNAAKYTLEGSVTITAGYVRENDEIYFCIEDTGIGIRSQDQPSIFESFRQVHDGLENVAGTGLGLPICKHFVEAHGGKIWFESDFGAGSTFYVTLPVNNPALVNE